MQGILQSIAIARIHCRKLARLRRSGEAEEALARSRELYSELLAAADLENPAHRSIVRNHRVNLSAMVTEVESCRLRHETQKALRERTRTAS